MTSFTTTTYLTCNPPFPIADLAAFQLLLEACALVENEVSSVMTDMDITKEHLQYVLPEQLHFIDDYAHLFELQHGCLTSVQKKAHCTWLRQLRGDVTLLLAKIGGSDNGGHDKLDLGTLLITLESLFLDTMQTGSEIIQIVAELLAPELRDPRQRLDLLSEKVDKLKKLAEQAEDLEKKAGCPERGLPSICNKFSEIRENAKQMLGMDFRLVEALVGVKDEL